MKNQKILIQVRPTEIKISKNRINRKIRQILSALGYEDHEISVVITTDSEIMELNKKFRGIEKPTNVLSFPMLEGEFNSISPHLLGDIVISSEKAMQEAGQAGISFDERISQLLVHGILHLIGFDHEKEGEGAGIMEAKSIEILRVIEKNPNLDVF